MKKTGEIMQAMIAYYAGDVRRINHFLKVFALAKTIGEMEGLEESAQEILEIAALTHDIGIRNSEKKYRSAAGNFQQIEGPPEAENLLREAGVTAAVIDRVCWLIAHHHTYDDIRGSDYWILVEADFLVNAYEDQMSQEALRGAAEKLIRTASGEKLFGLLYGL